MVYPVFEEKSIAARCLEDIKQFICKDTYGEGVDMESDAMKKNEFNDCFTTITDITPALTGVNASLQLDGLDTKSNLDTCIETLKMGIITILKENNIEYESFDYSHDIASFDSDKQRKLWILRTYVFYQLLIFATKIMKSETLFEEIYTSESKYKRVWRPDVTENELQEFKMGIFGSLTPTSDIDIGISYTGKTSEFAALDYVVAIFEDMFKIFMEKSSLQLDIEPYADMYILPNPNESDSANPYIFYLDTSEFDIDDFKQILPYVKTSILRNYVFAKLQLEHDSKIDTLSHVNKIVGDFLKNKGWETTTDFFKSHTSSAVYKNDATKYYVFNNLFNSSVELLKQNDPKDHDSSTMILSYMSKDYDTSREEYYRFVKDAEEYLATNIKPKVFNNEVLSKQMILDIMQKIGKTLTWRAESYTCGPTIMHVVRVLQANKNNPNKYKTNSPVCIYPQKDPMCALGPYGFMMSVMEQLGYIYRFNLTYKCYACNQQRQRTAITKDCAKCIKKYTKYNERIQNALEYITEPVKVFRKGGSRNVKKQQPKQTRHKRRGKQGDKHGGKRKTRKSKQ